MRLKDSAQLASQHVHNNKLHMFMSGSLQTSKQSKTC